MDFPVFHVDSIGNRMLIAIVAILHVAINHPLAVGGMPLIATLEWWGRRSGDARCDDIAYRLLRVCFIVTTTVGALTGVGIWFSVSLVNPYAIASLIRVFFWAWFTEWLVFITEVGLILAYYQTWQKWTGDRKSKHIRLGYTLALFSWITMALIVSILGFMMNPGDWESGGRLHTAILNPIYLPQLAFRTTLAMVQAGFFALLVFSCWRIPGDLRVRLVRFISTWILCFTPPLLCAAIWYRGVVPSAMAENFAVAVGTQQGAAWYAWLLGLSLIVALLAGVVAGVGRWRPRGLPRWALTIPFCASLALMAQFERVREFIRKPYVIGEYMYANGIRTQDVAILQRDGLLRHATYCSTRDILPENRLAAGRDVFQLACSRCHTMHGMNSLTVKFSSLLGNGEWSPDQMASYIENMHGARPFMPPFPGNQSELRALVTFIIEQRTSPTPLHGAQVVGVQLPRERTRDELIRDWTKVVEQSNVEADRQEALATLAAIRSPQFARRR